MLVNIPATVFYRNTYYIDHLFSSTYCVNEQLALCENILEHLKKFSCQFTDRNSESEYSSSIKHELYGPTKENGQWRIKTNEELITKYKAPDIVNIIKIQRLEWLGHVVRMNETRSVKKIFEGKLEGRRGTGRPRLGINDVEDDLRKLGVKRWRTKALEREEWAPIIKEAKAKLKGP